jgi:CheY-like chemotaxis protein
MALVVVVDDDLALGRLAATTFQKSRPQWQVRVFHQSTEALESFGAQLPDLLVTDVRMPGLTGFDLVLKLREVRPATPAIIMTAYADPAPVELTGPTLRQVSKPWTAAKLLTAADELLSPHSGFQGQVSLPQLPDLLQIHGLARTTGLLSVEADGRVGLVWFYEGRVEHSECDGLVGRSALDALLHWRGGRFSMSTYSPPDTATIQANVTELLLDTFRVDDERGAELQTSTPSGFTFGVSGVQTAPSSVTSFVSTVPAEQERESMPSNVKQCLDEAMQIEGALAVALVDYRNGMTLGVAGGNGLNLEVAAAGNTEVVRSKMRVMERLGIKGSIEDILITLDAQFHLIRLMQSKPGVFLYLAIAKDRGTLGMARLRLSDIEAKLQI